MIAARPPRRYDSAMIPFKIIGLSPEPFVHLYGLSDDELRERGALRYAADCNPGFPDRIEVRDADPGETLLLINHVHQPADTPYRASHAIFVREGAVRRFEETGVVPGALRVRPLSLRAFDDRHMMLDAGLVDGAHAEELIDKLLSNADVGLHSGAFCRTWMLCRPDRTGIP